MNTLRLSPPNFMLGENILLFDDAVYQLYRKHATPALCEKWRNQGQVNREIWEQAAPGPGPAAVRIHST